MKTKIKLIITFAIVIFALLLLNTNEVKAYTVTPEEGEQILNLLPSEISLEISEIEYEKAHNLVETKIKEILRNNNISNEIIDSMYIFGPNLSMRGIHKVEITFSSVSGGVNPRKIISVVYNNSTKKNTEDEQYVTNIMSKIKSSGYHEVDIETYKKIYKNNDWDGVSKVINDSYTKKINDNSVNVRIGIGAGGSEGSLNMTTFEGGTRLAIFKNNVLYYFETMGEETLIPVINIPNTVKNENIQEYVINKLKEISSEYGNNITKIEKGIDGFDVEIANGYTVYTGKEGLIETWIIINKTENVKDNNINISDTSTKIKLEADTNVLPENTQLETTKIENYTNTMLTNTNKFYAYDITLKSSGVKVQPNGKVKISIPIPKGMETTNLVVYRVEDNELIKYSVTVEDIEGVKYATFETDHFSTYVLAEVATTNEGETTTNEQNTTSKSREKDSTPKTGTTIIEFILEIISNIGKIIKI